jgi:hypothetical protein
MTTTLAEAILKNVQTSDATSGVAVAGLIMAEANRREHLAGGVQSVMWDRESGIIVQVDNAGQRQHLANAIDLPKAVTPFRGGALRGDARTGVFAGYRVVIWNLEA